MHPILFQLGEVGVRTYGVAIAGGFLVAIVLGARAARMRAIGVSRWLDLCFWLLVTSLLGARLLFVVTQARVYYDSCAGTAAGGRSLAQIAVDCSRPLHLWEGGLVYFGGLLTATLFALWYLRRRQIGFLRVADLAAPLIALGHAVGRLGCYAAGCCYGKVASFGARFPADSFAAIDLRARGLLGPAATTTPPLHPTQLYEAGYELLLFLALTLYTRRRRYHGQILVAYLALYSVGRFVIELFRDDPARRFVALLDTPRLAALLGLPADRPLLLSTSQLVALLTLGAALITWLVLRGRRRRRQTG